jgi:uncharacterized protein YigE (DUF2233 family)
MRMKPVQLCAAVLICLGLHAAAQAKECRDMRFEDASYIVCSFNPATEILRTFWRDANGRPYRTFDALAAALEGKGKALRFAMNGGMYRDDFHPVGLYIEEGRELAPANTTTLTGRPSQIPNFYKKPNGIFFVGKGKAGIIETSRFLARPPAAEFATQSGPMLVIEGKIHPAFIADSKDVKPRNGVCVASPTEVHFAITGSWVNFYDFARFFRDGLKCGNALFLDGGTAPGLYAPGFGRNDVPGHGGYGPIIAVIE